MRARLVTALGHPISKAIGAAFGLSFYESGKEKWLNFRLDNFYNYKTPEIEKDLPEFAQTSAIIKQAFKDIGVKKTPIIYYQGMGNIPRIACFSKAEKNKLTLDLEPDSLDPNFFLQTEKKELSTSGKCFWKLYSRGPDNQINTTYASLKVNGENYTGELNTGLVQAIQRQLLKVLNFEDGEVYPILGTAQRFFSPQPGVYVGAQYPYIPKEQLYALAGHEAVHIKHQHSKMDSFLRGFALYFAANGFSHLIRQNLNTKGRYWHSLASVYLGYQFVKSTIAPLWERLNELDADLTSADKLRSADDLNEFFKPLEAHEETFPKTLLVLTCVFNDHPLTQSRMKALEQLSRANATASTAKTSLFYQSVFAEDRSESHDQIECILSDTKPSL